MIVEEGVYRGPPRCLEHDDWGRWMARDPDARPEAVLSHTSAAAAWWVLVAAPSTRDSHADRAAAVLGAIGGVRRVPEFGSRRSSARPLHGIPITSVPRTVLDLARGVSDRALAQIGARSGPAGD